MQVFLFSEVTMLKIKVDEIEDGMILAQGVLDDRGSILLNAGDKLRKTYGAKLSAWGVKEVFVQGAESAPGARIQPQPETRRASTEIEDTIRARVNHRFACVAEDPLMRTLMDLSIKHLLARDTARRASV